MATVMINPTSDPERNFLMNLTTKLHTTNVSSKIAIPKNSHGLNEFNDLRKRKLTKDEITRQFFRYFDFIRNIPPAIARAPIPRGVRIDPNAPQPPPPPIIPQINIGGDGDGGQQFLFDDDLDNIDMFGFQQQGGAQFMLNTGQNRLMVDMPESVIQAMRQHIINPQQIHGAFAPQPNVFNMFQGGMNDDERMQLFIDNRNRLQDSFNRGLQNPNDPMNRFRRQHDPFDDDF